jgi:antitoxin component YwqK of YwqJK toxin-antitoxin module
MKNLLIILIIITSLTDSLAQVTCQSEKWDDEKFSGYCYTNYPNGQLQYKIHFEKGEKNGAYEEYYENGKKSAIANYKDWDLEGHCVRYFENGSIQIDMTIDSIGNGSISVYYSNGKLEKTGTYERYARVGVWSYYNKDGTLKEVKKFDEIDDHKKEQEQLDKKHEGENVKWIVEWPASVSNEFFIDSEEPYY